jgi:hypothetical protein
LINRAHSLFATQFLFQLLSGIRLCRPVVPFVTEKIFSIFSLSAIYERETNCPIKLIEMTKKENLIAVDFAWTNLEVYKVEDRGGNCWMSLSLHAFHNK